MSDEIAAAALWPALEWKTLFKTVTITKMDKLDGEDVYVVEKKPEKGTAVTDTISAKTFLLVKREAGGTAQSFSDYRTVEGVKVPFKRIVSTPGSSRNVITIHEVKFHVRPSKSLFVPRTMGAADSDAGDFLSVWQ